MRARERDPFASSRSRAHGFLAHPLRGMCGAPTPPTAKIGRDTESVTARSGPLEVRPPGPEPRRLYSILEAPLAQGAFPTSPADGSSGFFPSVTSGVVADKSVASPGRLRLVAVYDPHRIELRFRVSDVRLLGIRTKPSGHSPGHALFPSDASTTRVLIVGVVPKVAVGVQRFDCRRMTEAHLHGLHGPPRVNPHTAVEMPKVVARHRSSGASSSSQPVGTPQQ